MRVLLLLAFGLPVLVAQSLVARVELPSGGYSVVSSAVRHSVASTASSATVAPSLAGTHRWSSRGDAVEPASPEGSSARALRFVQHQRRQAT